MIKCSNQQTIMFKLYVQSNIKTIKLFQLLNIFHFLNCYFNSPALFSRVFKLQQIKEIFDIVNKQHNMVKTNDQKQSVVLTTS